MKVNDTLLNKTEKARKIPPGQASQWILQVEDASQLSKVFGRLKRDPQPSSTNTLKTCESRRMNLTTTKEPTMKTLSQTLPNDRRVFMLQAAAGCAAAVGAVRARAQTMVAENDAQATALGYKADATKVDKTKYPKYAAGQMCGNCALFQSAASAAAGGCPLFAGKQVAAKGWCSAWAKKG